MPTMRDATDKDVPAILDITNEAILNTTAIWDLRPITLDARAAWFQERRAAGFPVLVAEDNGAVIAFASYGAFHAKAGYRQTAEHSIYVSPSAQGKGLGRVLLTALLARAEDQGMHVMVGLIEAGNLRSIALHKQAGFREAGVLREVGRKFGRWLDLIYMERRLGERRLGERRLGGAAVD